MCRTHYNGSDSIINQEKALQKISETNPNFTILSDFQGWRNNITRKCNICGDIRTVQARSLIEKNRNGEIRGCTSCIAKIRGEKSRKTHKQYVEELFDINPNVELLDTYITSDQKIKCRCLIDGFEWNVLPKTLLEGHGCPECANRKQNRRTHDEFVQEILELFPNIIPLEEFKNMGTSMKFKCTDCNYEWQTAPLALFRDTYRGCPKCNGKMFHVPESEFVKRVEKINPRAKYIGSYKNLSTHANFECNLCGHQWHTLPSSILSGRGCPICNISHGALKIKEFLDNAKIAYELEYRFDDCKDNRSLPFDFYIESKNICIEYDGEQHFKPVRFKKNETNEQMYERFVAQQKRDSIKTKYCEENNITLIRIPYTEFNNINNILNKYFS